MRFHLHSLPRCLRHLRARALSLALLAASGSAFAVGSLQLVASVDQNVAYLNGDPARFQNPPRLVGGRLLLPLREAATLLNLPLDVQGTSARLGRLTFDLTKAQVSVDGAVQGEGAAVNVAGQVYVSAKLLADSVNANISFSADGRNLTLTVLNAPDVNPVAPQARFSTDKPVYAPGERIVYTDYSFDPDGADITARKWTGRQETFFSPGSYTVSLRATNVRGVAGAPFSRVIKVEGAPVDTPVSYAIKYAELGDIFNDPGILSYPAVTPFAQPTPSFPLLFSDSPEAPTASGLLYQDTVSGRARLLAYHLNGLKVPARLYVLARNLESRAVQLRTTRSGETAPTRIEGTLGQVTLMDYFASTATPLLSLEPGQATAVYASPLLNPGSGANVMQDLETTGRVELSFVMLEESLPPTQEVVQQLPTLASDPKHQRGTFPGAVRSLRVVLGQLPARLVIGDGNFDPVLQGVDVISGTPQRLLGNYGVLYDLEVQGASGASVALAPRGGLYRGAMQLTDGNLQQAIKLPRSGVLLKPDAPALLWRSASNKLHIDFVPASGSNLPISFIFYRAGQGGALGDQQDRKTYNP